MEVTDSREVYRNPWIRVREDVVRREDGSTGVYGVVEKPHFALVLPAERDGFWLVEQFRHPIGRRSWEFPQGAWPPDTSPPDTSPPYTLPPGTVPSGADRSPEQLARAELAEETGLRAGTMRHLGHLDQSPGLSTQEFDVWLATDLVPGPTAREETEADMVSAFVSEAELRAMVRAGRFTDGPSLAAWALLLLDRS